MKRRARIEDVVRLSGLSRSTVDRVLNGRPGVKAATIERVENTIRDLGYAPSALEYHSKARLIQIEILVSEGTNPFFDQIRAGMEIAAERERHMGITFKFRMFDPYDPSTILHCLKDVDANTTSVITLGVEDPRITKEIDALESRGVRVVTIISDATQSKRSAYVGQDNFSAGRTAGRLMSNLVTSGAGDIAILIGHLQFRHLLDRQSGFQNALSALRPELTIHHTQPYGTDPDTARRILDTISDQCPNLKGVYLSGGGQPAIIETLRSNPIANCTVLAHEVNPTTRSALHDGVFRMIVAHDMDEVGRKAVDAALGLDKRSVICCGINVFVPENLPPD